MDQDVNIINTMENEMTVATKQLTKTGRILSSILTKEMTMKKQLTWTRRSATINSHERKSA